MRVFGENGGGTVPHDWVSSIESSTASWLREVVVEVIDLTAHDYRRR